MKSNKIDRIFKKLFAKEKEARSEGDFKKDSSTEEVMGSIYRKKTWGGRKHDFYSGQGSHLSKIVDPYVKKILQFLESFDPKLTVCDLGCGDFNVGNRLVDASSRYIGVDIVPELIARNRERFTDPKLEFRCLNIVTEELPPADCILVRQVLQHLSNDEIVLVVKKLKKYKYLIVTEHVPKGDFVPNLEKKTGANIRLSQNSGVVLTASPFNYKPMKERELIQVHIKKGQIVTTLYQNF
jgi:2-polyprenyl-3-methyl-5-hydroxy-6-metoxy-1,4-benzoquinol methylase